MKPFLTAYLIPQKSPQEMMASIGNGVIVRNCEISKLGS